MRTVLRLLALMALLSAVSACGANHFEVVATDRGGQPSSATLAGQGSYVGRVFPTAPCRSEPDLARAFACQAGRDDATWRLWQAGREREREFARRSYEDARERVGSGTPATHIACHRHLSEAAVMACREGVAEGQRDWAERLERARERELDASYHKGRSQVGPSPYGARSSLGIPSGPNRSATRFDPGSIH